MSHTISIAPVRKNIRVKTTPQRAFEVFTAGIDRWWPKSHGVGGSPVQKSIIEPFVGGRWYTIGNDGAEAVVGHVRVWQPAERLVVSWEIDAKWHSEPRAAFASEVEVRFRADGAATLIELEHRDFERMGAEGGEKMRNDVNGGWPKILELYASELRASSGA